MKTKFHLCVMIDKEIEMIAKGKRCLSGSVSEQIRELNKAKREGKTYFTGCDNMDETGRCAGHPIN